MDPDSETGGSEFGRQKWLTRKNVVLCFNIWMTSHKGWRFLLELELGRLTFLSEMKYRYIACLHFLHFLPVLFFSSNFSHQYPGFGFGTGLEKNFVQI